MSQTLIDRTRLRLLAWRQRRGRPLPRWGMMALALLDRVALCREKVRRVFLGVCGKSRR